jgi:DNA-directed RNA polymerase subunit RPC12/RpoP
MEKTNQGHVYQCPECGKLYLEQYAGLIGALCPRCIRLLEESEEE